MDTNFVTWKMKTIKALELGKSRRSFWTNILLVNCESKYSPCIARRHADEIVEITAWSYLFSFYFSYSLGILHVDIFARSRHCCFALFGAFELCLGSRPPFLDQVLQFTLLG